MEASLRGLTTVSLTASNCAVFDGLSTAAPHVSGVFCCRLELCLALPCAASQICASLSKSAQDPGAPGRDIHCGFGPVQAKRGYDRIGSKGCVG